MASSRKSLRSRAAVLAVVVAATLASADAASAYVSSFQLVTVSGPLNSEADKSIEAVCPGGKRLVGGGGGIAPPQGQVSLQAIRPDAGLTKMTVQGLEDEDGHASNWLVTAYAICAVPMPGLQLVVATSASSSANKAATATCPAGKKVMGTGGEIVGGAGEVALDDVRPNLKLTAVIAQGLEDENGTLDNWAVSAWAICASPVGGLSLVTAQSAQTSADKSVTVTCPADRLMLGAGGELGQGAGRIIRSIRPSDSLRRVEVAGREDQDGTTASWLVRAYAICADAVVRTQAVSVMDSSAEKSLTAPCPQHFSLLGGGGEVSGAPGDVLMQQFWPGTVQGFEIAPGTADAWRLHAYGVCGSFPAGFQRVSAVSDLAEGSFESVTVECPVGKKVIAVAGVIFGAEDSAFLRWVAPEPDLTSAHVSAMRDDDEPGDWAVAALAVCANPLPGLEVVSATSPFTDANKTVVASCPAGKVLLGTGASVADILVGPGVVIDDIRPAVLLNSVLVGAAEHQETFESWRVTAYAICASM